MKKTISHLLVVCLLVMCFSGVCYAASFQPILTAEDGTVGDTVTVTVSLPANTGAAGGSFNLVYDNTKMELVDATAGSLIAAFSKTVNKTYATNKIRLNFAGSETVSASGGVVLTATFKLLSAGTATVSTEKFKLADIDTNYLTCADSTKNISITSGQTTTFQPILSAENGAVGDTVTVTVSLPTNTNAAGGSFNLVYDNSKMELVDATAGSLIAAFSKTVNKTYAANKVRLNFAGSETVSASGGILLTATFKLLSAGTATVSTEKFKLADIDTNYLTCADSEIGVVITGTQNIAVTNVTLNKTTATMTVGESLTLTATVSPNNATNKAVAWTSSNTSVATVSNGVVTAKGSGSANITVKTVDGNKTAVCAVTVTAPQSADAPTVEVVNATGRVGKFVDVVIAVKNNPGIAVLGFDIEYDSDAMTLQTVTVNDIFAEGDITAGDIAKNPYTFSALTIEGNKDANGNLVTLTFQIREDCVEGDYAITLTNVEAYTIDEDEVQFKLENGIVTVTDVEPGDTTGDGKVNRLDLLRLAKYLTGWDVSLEETAADVTGDGKVNRLDQLRLAKYLAGWDVKLGK